MNKLTDPNPNEPTKFSYKKKVLDLGRSLVGVTKIYLDTKFWVWLADHALGKAVPSGVDQLSKALHKGVSEGRFICPFNYETFTEMFRQSDPKTLRSTARMVDGFSRNVCMMAWPERQRAELFNFVRSKTHGSDSVYPLDHMIWTRPLYVTGFMMPPQTPFDPPTERAIQQSFMDHTWSLTLEGMLDVRQGEPLDLPDLPKDISAQLNQGKDAHADEHKDFKSLFLAELAGILDAVAVDLEWVMTTAYGLEEGKYPTPQELEQLRADRSLAKLIYNCYRLDKLSTELPFLHIPAMMHSAIRRDRTRRFKANDAMDIGHAKAALPYCDLFLTENSLKTLLTRKDLGLDRQYECQVVAKVEQAVEAVNRLSK